MKTRIVIASLMVLLSMTLFSCGGGGGVAGSNSGDTNIIIASVSVTSDSNHDIDVFADALARTDAVITIGAEKLNANLTPFPATLTKCSINYKPVEPGSPVIPDLTIRPDCPILEGDNACTVVLMDIQRKQDFWTAMNDGTHNDIPVPTHYVAEYRCDYQNSGGEGNFPASYDIWLADFAGPVPPLSIFPDTATILANGGSASFLITGGLPPYQVFLDNNTLVDLAFDRTTDNFTVTGKNNGTGTVTITVIDSLSQEATATVDVQ